MTKKTTAPTITQRLFAHLHRGGTYAHLWTDAGHRSYWFHVNASQRKRTIPRRWRQQNVYFTVHPLSQIPPTNASGNTNPRYISSQLAYISAINSLFAEYDGKDTVDLDEYELYLPTDFATRSPIQQQQARKAAQEKTFFREPARYKQRAWEVIQSLDYAPSIIVDSGGGYHCYWLLRATVPLDEANRSDVQTVQHGWVQMVGGDVGASDLRRILRVPGTYNMKEGFGAAHPTVTTRHADFDLLYDYRDLEEAVNDWLHAHQPTQASSRPRRQCLSADGDRIGVFDSVRARFNQTHSSVDILTRHGYTVAFQSETMTRLARPGRSRYRTSVTVFHARANGTPELSVHFSTNDELYSAEYMDEETGQVKRQAHDAYYLAVMLDHGGDWHAAYMAAMQGQHPAQLPLAYG